MASKPHRGHDPDAYDERENGITEGTSLTRTYPLCGAEDIMLPKHLPECPGGDGE